MPERSRSPRGPRHLAPGTGLSWWASLDTRRLRVALGTTLLALPLLVLDNLPADGRRSAEAVETVDAPAEPTSATSTTATTTLAPATTVPPTTEAPTTAPPPTAAPTTAPPTTAARTLSAPATTAPPTTAPPTTAPPTTAAPPPAPPPPPAGTVEAIIHQHFGAEGAQAVEVARCESSLNASARNPRGYYGLFQIGAGHAATFERVTGVSFDAGWFDADANTRYAKWLRDRYGWGQWGCASH